MTINIVQEERTGSWVRRRISVLSRQTRLFCRDNPWLAGSTVLTQVLPQAALDGGIAKLLARLADAAERHLIRPAIKPEAHWGGVVITSVEENAGSLIGRSIQEIADERQDKPEDVVMDILLEQHSVPGP